MSLDRILQRIDDDARAGAAAILDSARAEADRRLASRKAAAGAEADAILVAAGTEADRLLRQAGAGARLESSRQLLARKREWLQRVTEAALDRLLGPAADLHRSVLARLLERHAGEGMTSITFSGDPVGAEAASSFKRAGLTPTIAAAGRDPRGGVIIQCGPLLLDLSFPRLMEETAERHQADLQSALFGESA